MLIVTTKNTVF